MLIFFPAQNYKKAGYHTFPLLLILLQIGKISSPESDFAISCSAFATLKWQARR
jgi:hypothetical protein